MAEVDWEKRMGQLLDLVGKMVAAQATSQPVVVNVHTGEAPKKKAISVPENETSDVPDPGRSAPHPYTS